MEEPMDIDTLDTDFDNKENSILHSNVLPRTPSTEKGYEELDVSELNMKLRYSVTPASSPMSRSFNVNCTENKLDKENPNITITDNSHMTRSLHTTNTTATFNDTLKSFQTQPVQVLPTESQADNNKSVLQRLDSQSIDNVTITVDNVPDDETLSLPSTSSSLTHTPDATTPTKEISKDDGGSPILRGLKSVFSMFRSSQSPITTTEENLQNEITVLDPETQKLLASTPISSQKYKESASKKSPYKESIAFTENLEKELQWEDETTIIFSQEKIPIHKLFPQDKSKQLSEHKEVLKNTVEYMDVSYNDSALGDITITNNQSVKTVKKNDMTLGESDSEFVDCETTFTKDNSTQDVYKNVEEKTESQLTSQPDRSMVLVNSNEITKISYDSAKNKNVTVSHETQNNTVVEYENIKDGGVASQSNIENNTYILELTNTMSTTLPENNTEIATDLISTEEKDKTISISTAHLQNIADVISTGSTSTEEKHENIKSECTEEHSAKTKLSDETINLDITNNFEINNYTISNDQNSTIDILTSIENITEENVDCMAIINSKNNSQSNDNIESNNRNNMTLPTDIPLPEEDEIDTIAISQGDTPENDIISEACEETKLNVHTKQYDITYENISLNNTITECGNESVLLSKGDDERTAILPEDNKEKNNVDALYIHNNKEDKHTASEMVVAHNKIDSENPCCSQTNYLQPLICEIVKSNISISPENELNLSQPNTLETTITVEKLMKDERVDKQTEMPMLGSVSEGAEVLKNEEEVILSETNSPYVSLSAVMNETESQQQLVEEAEEVKEIETPFISHSFGDSPPSPKIMSRGSYNFNFDEMDDPFAAKTKIRASTSPEKKNVSLGPAESISDINQETVNVLKETTDKCENMQLTIDNHNETNNLLQKYISDNEENIDQNKTDKKDEQANIQVEIIGSKEDMPEFGHQEKLSGSENIGNSGVVEEKNSVVVEINNVAEAAARIEHKESPYFEPSEFNECNLSKNIFNIPEIEHAGFNPFVTVSKMRHSPDKSPDNAFDNKSVLNESHEDLNCTTSSKVTDGKNITVREINTEDEDTVEGPFLESDEFSGIDKVADFDGEKVDMIQFSDINNDGVEENEEGEMFIDAEAFEFLLNQNKAMVADSGKESLFLKFDPLFAKRMSMIQEKQRLNKTPTKHSPTDSTVPNVSSVPSPSNVMDMSYEITNASFEDKYDESINNTIIKPTMIVTPAVNLAVSPRNKTITPTRSNRRSFTFTSPAIAVIDRLLSMSANNSILGQDSTMIHVSNEQHEAELALTQLRELLAEKEISVHELKCESNELRFRLETLESQMKKIEEESKERLQNINSLNEKLEEKTRDNKNMAVVVEEYERTIASLIAEKEQEKRMREEERMKLIRERDEQTAHLGNMECSFNDLHSKYEKSKGIILSYKANEDTYRKTISDFESNFAKVQNNYELLKQHATSKLNHANQELEKINRAHEADVLKLHTMLKRKEVEITSLEESLAQKTKANDELAAICDELINKVG